jgi:NitT/TauT family transport system substrate-binding protein
MLRIFMIVAVLLTAFGTAVPPATAQTLTPVRMIIDPTFYAHLPIMRAIDMGYFKAEGIDLQITPASGSSTLFLPMLARNEYDLGTVNPSPAFFNQFSGGFSVVIVAGQGASHAGWHGVSWLLVRQDLWDAKAIARPADLKGHIVDGSNVGSPIDFLLKSAMAAGGVAPADVRISEHYRAMPDWLEAFRNKAVDVIGAPEPQASQLEAQGLAHRWISFDAVVPWYQLEFVGASAKFSQDHPDLIRKFLRAYLRGNDDVLKSNGKWTPQLLTEAVKWTGQSADALQKLGGPQYPTLHGEVSVDALARIQQFWVNEKLVTAPVDVNNVVNLTMLHEVQKSLHY